MLEGYGGCSRVDQSIDGETDFTKIAERNGRSRGAGIADRIRDPFRGAIGIGAGSADFVIGRGTVDGAAPGRRSGACVADDVVGAIEGGVAGRRASADESPGAEDAIDERGSSSGGDAVGIKQRGGASGPADDTERGISGGINEWYDP